MTGVRGLQVRPLLTDFLVFRGGQLCLLGVESPNPLTNPSLLLTPYHSCDRVDGQLDTVPSSVLLQYDKLEASLACNITQIVHHYNQFVVVHL